MADEVLTRLVEILIPTVTKRSGGLQQKLTARSAFYLHSRVLTTAHRISASVVFACHTSRIQSVMGSLRAEHPRCVWDENVLTTVTLVGAELEQDDAEP